MFEVQEPPCTHVSECSCCHQTVKELFYNSPGCNRTVKHAGEQTRQTSINEGCDVKISEEQTRQEVQDRPALYRHLVARGGPAGLFLHTFLQMLTRVFKRLQRRMEEDLHPSILQRGQTPVKTEEVRKRWPEQMDGGRGGDDGVRTEQEV